MAKAEVVLPDEFLQKLSKLSDRTDEISERVLEAGGEVVLAKIRSNLASVVGKDTKVDSRSTGELERSLGMSKARVDRNGNHNIKIGFAEPRSDGGSNAKIANILEYGRHGQPADDRETACRCQTAGNDGHGREAPGYLPVECQCPLHHSTSGVSLSFWAAMKVSTVPSAKVIWTS